MLKNPKLKSFLRWASDLFSRNLVSLAVLVAVYFYATEAQRARYEDLLLEVSAQHQEALEGFQETRNEIVTLHDLVLSHDETLVALASRKPQSIVTTTTVFEGSQYSYETLPESYTYKLNGEIPVATFEAKQGSYTFGTETLTFQNVISVSKKETLSKLTVTSSGSDQEWVVPQTVTVQQLSEHRFLEPQLAIGLTATYPLDAGLGVGLPILHPSDAVDLLSPKLMFGNSTHLGLDLVGYRVGKHLPLLEDTWVYVGASHNFVQPHASLTIGTKL